MSCCCNYFPCFVCIYFDQLVGEGKQLVVLEEKMVNMMVWELVAEKLSR